MFIFYIYLINFVVQLFYQHKSLFIIILILIFIQYIFVVNDYLMMRRMD